MLDNPYQAPFHVDERTDGVTSHDQARSAKQGTLGKQITVESAHGGLVSASKHAKSGFLEGSSMDLVEILMSSQNPTKVVALADGS